MCMRHRLVGALAFPEIAIDRHEYFVHDNHHYYDTCTVTTHTGRVPFGSRNPSGLLERIYTGSNLLRQSPTGLRSRPCRTRADAAVTRAPVITASSPRSSRRDAVDQDDEVAGN